MACLKVTLVLVGVAAASAEYSQASASDDVTLLQSQVQEKSAKHVDTDDEFVDEYKLKESLKCASEAIAPALVTSIAEAVPVREEIPDTAISTSSDPPSADAFKSTLCLMIIVLLFDGVRRWNVQRLDTKKQQVADKRSAHDSEAAADAAWVDMVNAAASGDVNSFAMALNHKPRVMQADTWGCTPLHFAAVGGSVAIAKELLNRGVEVDPLDACDETPLHFAARAGQGPMCELLLGAGAKMDAVNERGLTPLIVAGQANAQASCHLLVNHGAGVAGLADEDLPALVVSQLVQKVFATAH